MEKNEIVNMIRDVRDKCEKDVKLMTKFYAEKGEFLQHTYNHGLSLLFICDYFLEKIEKNEK